MREHCYYCDKALYRMFLTKGVCTSVNDIERHENSDGERICQHCLSRLIKRGTAFNCPYCHVPVYELRDDHFREKQIKRRHLKGIAPQPDPYDRAFIKCRHCNNEVNCWE